MSARICSSALHGHAAQLRPAIRRCGTRRNRSRCDLSAVRDAGHGLRRDHVRAAHRDPASASRRRSRRPAAAGLRRPAPPIAPRTMPSTRRQNARATNRKKQEQEERAITHGYWPPVAGRGGMRVLQAFERPLRRLPFRRVGRDRDDLLPRLPRRRRDPACRTRERCPCSAASWCASASMRQRVLELLDRLVGLVRVVVRDAEVGGHVRRPAGSIASACSYHAMASWILLGVEVDVPELHARLRVLRILFGDGCVQRAARAPGRAAAACWLRRLRRACRRPLRLGSRERRRRPLLPGLLACRAPSPG